MTRYNVHIYRETRLTFAGIEAETPEAAARIARQETIDEADEIDDCEGENFAALVDVHGDEEYEQSVLIAFEPERQREAATRLLAALEGILDLAENEAFTLRQLTDSSEAQAEATRAWKAMEIARAAIAEARADLPCESRETDAPPANGHVWSTDDARQIRSHPTDGEAQRFLGDTPETDDEGEVWP